MPDFDFIYQFLSRIGYHHPIHPTETHMPIGLVTGALLLGFAGLIFKRQFLYRSARHCFILALLFLFGTVLFGFMDWQHFYAGAWLFPLKMKLTLAGILLGLFILGLIVGRGEGLRSNSLLVIYVLCFLTVVGLGYFGGQLVFGGISPQAPPTLRAGQGVFDARCGRCHPQGGNNINPDAPVLYAPQLKDLSTFLYWIRNPRSPMPPFPPALITDEQGNQLYLYLINVLEKPKRI